jgi:putative intracellular protease/amidase
MIAIPAVEVAALQAKQTSQEQCILILVADGFQERDAIILLSLLRQAGLCVKSVGLASGLVGGAHGVWLMPDLTLAALDRWTSAASISVVILPQGRQSLNRLETDPRVHKLLRQIVAQNGQIVTSHEGLGVLRAAALWSDELEQTADDHNMPVLLREPGQSPETLAQRLIRGPKRWSQV